MNRRAFLTLFVMAYSTAMAKAGIKLERPWDSHLPPERYRDRLKWRIFERTWLKLWQIQNNPPCYLNSGIGSLAHILDREPTEAEKRAVAGFVQWLGTNCGHGFLVEALEVQGYRVVQDDTLPNGPALRVYRYQRGDLPKKIRLTRRDGSIDV